MPIHIESDRLRIRPISLDDVSFIHQLLCLPETDRYNALGIPENESHTMSMVQGWVGEMEIEDSRNHTLAIELQAERRPIGLYGIKLTSPKYRRAELWYKIHRDDWGNGYGTEATGAALKYCFKQLRLHRVEAGVAVENLASIRVLEKSGMTREGRMRKSLPLKTGFADSFLYAILQEDQQGTRDDSNE